MTAPIPSIMPRPSRLHHALRVRSASCFVLIDLLSIAGGFGLAAIARTALFGTTNWLMLPLTLLPIYLISAINNDAYTSENLNRPFLAIRRGLQAFTLALAATVFLSYSLKSAEAIPRFVATGGFLLGCAFMTVGRYAFARHFERIIGGNPFSSILIHERGQPMPSPRFSDVVEAEAFDPAAHDALTYNRLAKTLQGVDRVVVACAPQHQEAWAHLLKGINVQGEIIASEVAELGPLGIGRCGDAPTIIVSRGPLGLIDRLMKRTLDLVLASAALVALAPLLAAVALAIKLDSRGPVLFRQTRVGRDNELFAVLKFRSMRVETSDRDGLRSTARDDDRITRVGRFIRRTSLDELPQLFNVLKSDMSIVGPRPHARGSRAAEKLFWEVDRRYWHRHVAKPGLTGLAQVRGFRGATLEEADLENRLQADLEYLENWTIWRDVKIILLTFRVIFHRNAF